MLDTNHKAKSKSYFKPKIQMIETSSDDSEYADESDIKDTDNIDDQELSDNSEYNIEFNDSDKSSSDDESGISDLDSDDNELSESEKDDFDYPDEESSKKQNITFGQFNSYYLQEKQDTIQELIENTTNDNLKEILLIIGNILKFLSKYDSIDLPNCFELSVDNQNMQMTSNKSFKYKNLLKASISNKTINFFNRNSNLGQFLKLFKKFKNVSINLTKKSSSKVFDKLIENIQNLHDGKHKQFNIVLTIDEAVIEESEFENNTAIKSVILSPSVKTIKKHAFYNCKSLEKVTFSNSLKFIGVGAFQNCTSLQEAIIPDSVTKLSAYSFCGCHSLTKVKLSSSLSLIGTGSFKYCNSLKKKPTLNRNTENKPKNPKSKRSPNVITSSEESHEESDDDSF